MINFKEGNPGKSVLTSAKTAWVPATAIGVPDTWHWHELMHKALSFEYVLGYDGFVPGFVASQVSVGEQKLVMVVLGE